MSLCLLLLLLACSAFAQTNLTLVGVGRTASGGGGSTITARTPSSCYTATTCSITVAVGDLVVGFVGWVSGTVVPLASSSNCSSSGTFTGAATNNNNSAAGGMWCIASGTSVTISSSNCAFDCGLEIVGYHSTTGWNAASVVSNQAVTTTTLVPQCPLVSPAATNNVIACYVLDEATSPTYSSVSTPFAAGPSEPGHADYVVQALNRAAAAYTPTVTFTGTGSNWAMVAVAMGTN